MMDKKVPLVPAAPAKPEAFTFRNMAIFCLFICTDVGKVFAFSWAIHGTAVQSQTIVVMTATLSILIGALLTCKDGAGELKHCVDLRAICRFFVIAMLFSLNQTLGALQYVALSPATAKALAQVQLPILALGSLVVLGRIYTLRQWVALLLVTATVIVFTEVHAGDEQTGGQLFGYVCSVAASACTVVAGLFSEKFLKRSMSTPFYTQKVQIEIGGVIVATTMMFFMPVFADFMGLANKDSLDAFNERKSYSCNGVIQTVWGEGKPEPKGCELVGYYKGNFFDGWQFSTVVCLVMQMFQAWMAGFLAKSMSQVMKQVGQCLSLLVCYFLGDCLIFARTTMNPVLTLTSFLVVGSVALFITSPPYTSPDIIIQAHIGSSGILSEPLRGG
jgi:drug/metabolite transporter (DMT)-like permease